MSSFDIAIKTVLQHEGGFVNNPNDPGGATNYGVSLRFLKSTGQLNYDFDGDGDIDADDIKCMTQGQACEIYKKQWWDKYGYDRILSDALATKLLDMAVNMGQSQAVKLVQRALLCYKNNSLVVDGILGYNTISAINSINIENLLYLIRKEQTTFYETLITNNPKLAVFRNGWMNRALA